MAIPSIVAPGIPDMTTQQGVDSSIDTSIHFTQTTYELLFDGDSSPPTNGLMPAWNPSDTSYPLSISVDIDMPDASQTGVIWNNNTYQWRLTLNAPNQLRFQMATSNIEVALDSDGPHHIVCELIDSSNARVILDGVEHTGTNTSDPATNVEVTVFGSNENQLSGGFDGVIKNLNLNGERNYPINDGPGSTVFVDTIASQHATQRNIVDSDWQVVT